MNLATFDDFQKIELVVGTVLEISTFDRAKKPAYRVKVNFGEKYRVLETSAQVTKYYKAEDLIGKRVIGCVNIGTRNISGFTSQFLLCGFADQEGCIVLPMVNVPENCKLEDGSKLC